MKRTSKISQAILAVLVAVALVMADSNGALAAGAWTGKTPMPAARSHAAAAVINDVLYVAGGHDGVVGTTTLQAYNPATDSWSTLAPLPGRRYNGDGAGVINGELYLPGGWNYPDSTLPQSSLLVYNPGTNSWRTETSLPTLSGNGASGVITGKLYVTTAANGYSGWRDFLHVYDPVTSSWSSLAPSPNVHVNPAFGVIDGKFYVAGGRDASEAPSNKLDVYDPVANTWATKAPMPAVLRESAGAIINGKLYVIGGSNTAGVYNTVYVYDPLADAWTTETAMPTARFGAAAGVINGVLYVAGGANSTGGALATVEAFTTTPEATWTTKTPMPAARSYAAAAVINGVLYVAGGHDGVTGGTTTLQAYNPATNTWSTLAAMPGRRYLGDGAGIINGELYLPGGWNYPDSGLPQSTLFVYNPGTNSWSSKASMPALSGDGASGVINGKLYVTTAANGFSGYRDYLHVYDPATNTWSQLASSPNVHDAPAFGVINNKFYVAGGGDANGTPSDKLDIYDPATNTWTTKASMPAVLRGSASAIINGKLYVIGGSNTAGVYLNTVYVYDPATDTWTTETAMSTARAGAAAGVINGVLYVAGGGNSTGTLATVEAFTEAAINTYTLTVNIAGSGSVTRSPDRANYDHGTSVQLTVTPAEGYHFVGWSGDQTGSTSPAAIIMNSNKTVTATFAVNTYTITASAGAGGSITPSGAVTVNHGGSQSFAITPNTGYHIADVLVDGVSVGAVPSYTFTNVGANRIIAATFAITNQPPFALFSYSPQNPQANQLVMFNASASFDPDGSIVNYSWTFGDNGTASGLGPTGLGHTYLAAGSYSVTLTVRDDDGWTNTTTKTVTVSASSQSSSPSSGRRSLPDPSTLAMVGSGLAGALLYIGLSRLRRRLSRS